MFHFTIRDMLWLTVVVAMGVAWWASGRKQAAIIEYYAHYYDEHAALKSDLEKATKLLDEYTARALEAEHELATITRKPWRPSALAPPTEPVTPHR
jgi:hypothetical protein